MSLKTALPILASFCAILGLAGCTAGFQASVVEPSSTALSQSTSLPSGAATPTATPSASPTSTPKPTATPKPSATPSPTPSTATGPKGIATPQNLVDYFNQIKGKGVVSSEFVETGSPAASTTGPIATIQQMTGQWLGMIGGDYWHFGATGAPDTTYPLNAYAISYWQSGGLLTMNQSMPNPSSGGGADDTSSVDATGILTAGNATNTAFNQNLALRVVLGRI
jgi:hypothetical protein